MDKDITQLKAIWKKIFKDTDDYIRLFFETKYSPDKCYIEKTDSIITSMLYYWDVILYDGTESYKTAYICGIATLDEYRGRGQASKLIKSCISDIKEKGYDFAILIPATLSLFDYYKKFGFEVFSELKYSELENFTKEPETKACGDIYKFYDSIDCIKPLRDEKDFAIISKCYKKPFVFDDGYIIAYNENNTLNIIEHSYQTKEKLISRAGSLIDSSINKISVKSPVTAGFGEARPFSAYINFKNKPLKKERYINLLLN